MEYMWEEPVKKVISKKVPLYPDKNVYIEIIKSKKIFYKITCNDIDRYNKISKCSAKFRNNWLEISYDGSVRYLKPARYDRTRPVRILHGIFYFLPGGKNIMD